MFTGSRFFGTVILTGAAGALIAGCSSPAPAPATAPPPVAYSAPAPVAVFTPEQLNKLRQASPDTAHRVQVDQPLTVPDVKLMAKLAFPPEVINEQIRNSHSVYYLNANEIIDLKQSGVPDAVVDVMITTPSAEAASASSSPQVPPPGSPGAATGAQTPPPPPQVETPPPAPGTDYVWVDGDWVWRGGWVWTPGRWALPPYPGGIWFHGGWVHGGPAFRREGGRWRRWR